MNVNNIFFNVSRCRGTLKTLKKYYFSKCCLFFNITKQLFFDKNGWHMFFYDGLSRTFCIQFIVR